MHTTEVRNITSREETKPSGEQAPGNLKYKLTAAAMIDNKNEPIEGALEKIKKNMMEKYEDVFTVEEHF